MDYEDLKRQLNDTVDRWASSQRPPAPVAANSFPAEHGAATIAFSAPEAETVVERQLPQGKRVVRTKSSGDRVFLLDDTKSPKTRQWISKPEVMDAQGFIMEDVVSVEDSELLGYTQGPPLV